MRLTGCSACPRSAEVQLAAKQRAGVTVPLTASGVGNGTVTVHVSGPGGFDLERSYPLSVKPATQVAPKWWALSIQSFQPWRVWRSIS